MSEPQTSPAPSDSSLALAFVKKSPEAAARVLTSMPADAAARFISQLPGQQAAKVLASLQPYAGAKALELLPAPEAAVLVAALEPGPAVTMIRQMVPDARRRLLAQLPAVTAAALKKALSFAPNTVGAHMSTTVAVLYEHDSVAGAIELIRNARKSHVDAVYVLDPERALAGTVSSAELLCHPADTPLAEIMDRTQTTVSAHRRLDAAAELAAQYDLTRLPVVNRRHQVIGAISRRDLHPATQPGAQSPANTRLPVAGHLCGALAVTVTGLLSLLFGRADSQGPVIQAGEKADDR